MKVSVIIPVYNAARFIRAAVASALDQPEVQEILLVEDGSKDESPYICKELAQDPRVRMLTHPENRNHGAAASRNLGIKNAQMPFIAFLDADDQYEANRFHIAKTIFAEHADANGVHETIGIKFHPSLTKDEILNFNVPSKTGISVSVSPEHLFNVLASGKYGHIHLDGLTIRKASLDTDALFDPTLMMSEDSDFILRLASRRRLYCGDLSSIVAIRGIHGQNSILTNPRVMHYRRAYLQKCIDNHFYGSKDPRVQFHIISRRVGVGKFYTPFRPLGGIARPIKIISIAGYLLMRPMVLRGLLKC